MLTISPVDKVYVRVAVSATLADGSTYTVTGASFACLAIGGAPTSSTSWTAASTFSAGVAQMLIAGPQASPTSAVPLPPNGGDLWMEVTASPEVQAVRVATINVAGAS